jgi:uncharacterized membrane protein YbaN (DUF454 family)
MPGTPEPPVHRPSRSAARGVWLVLGLLFVALGLIGAVLPLVPTTIFLILAAGCFARSSPRLEAWLLDHPQFGPGLRAWRTERAISPCAKIAAVCGITLGYLLFWLAAGPDLAVGLAVAAAMAACAAYVVTRPSPRAG